MSDAIEDKFLVSFECYKECGEEFMVIRLFQKDKEELVCSCVMRHEQLIYGQIPAISLSSFMQMFSEIIGKIDADSPVCVALSRWTDGSHVALEKG